MNAKEAADAIRPNFNLESMPPEDRHHVLFVEDVATELGVEHTPFNLHQVATALDAANISQDSNEYPKMLYSRQHHAVENVAASVYDPRNDYVWAHVDNEDQARALGSDWVENPADLPDRGEAPVYEAPTADPARSYPVSGITPATRDEYEAIATSEPSDGLSEELIAAAKKWLAENPVKPAPVSEGDA